MKHYILAGALLASLPAQAQMQHMMSGALGDTPMTREASGTSWQPDSSPMAGIHLMRGEWMLMLHGAADVVYDQQGGARGDEMVFVASNLMAMAQRDLGPGTLGLRTMLSLDPLMGKRGYPLLMQTGETADGVDHLLDRQHPHDFFMELAATYSVPVGEDASVFGYFGLPGEPALGPSAFMHRPSAMALPEAPLTHHWLDSTHITFGVATLGAIMGDWKLEASAFNGREPDQYRWNIETRAFDSWSGRVTWNPEPDWSMQLSYGYLASPEQLDPDVAVHRATASISNVQPMSEGRWSTTLAVGVNREGGENRPAYLLETTREYEHWSAFARGEYLHNDHLVETGPLAGEEFRVGKLSLGGLRRIGASGHVTYSVGALASVYAIPAELESEYGSNPLSGMVFLRAGIE